MKKFTLILVLTFVFATTAFATDYAVSTAKQEDDAVFVWAMEKANAQTCQYYGLLSNCTQKQARQEFCKRASFGGVTTCTPNKYSTPDVPLPDVCVTTPLVHDCPGAFQVEVYSTVPDYIQKKFKLMVIEMREERKRVRMEAVEKAKTGTVEQRNALCKALGYEDGCLAD